MAGNTLAASTGKIVSGTASNIAFYIKCEFRQPTAGATSGVQMRIGLEGAFTNPLPAEIQQSVTLTLWRDTTSYGSDISYNFEKSNPGSSYSQWSGWMTVSGLTHTTGTDSFRIHYSSNGMFYSSGWMYASGKLYWTKDSGGGGSTTYTKCIAPTIVKVGASTSYTANSSVYNTTAPTPGQFYITWNAGSAGTGTSINGYERRAQNTLGGTPYTATTSSSVRYSLSNQWTTAAVGYSYRCDVRTLSSVSGYDSDWSTSYGTVIFSASKVTSTLVLNPEGGTINGSTSNKTINITLGNLLELPVPTREGYNFRGWYYSSNTTNYMNMGSYYVNQGSFSASCWTYAASYQGTTRQTILSCTQGGGWALQTTANGASWQFCLANSSGTYKYVNIPKAQVSDGYHDWCVSFNQSTQEMKLWLDGVLKGTTSLGSSTWKMPSTVKLYIGDEMEASGDGGTGFAGKIGNVVISSDTELYESAPTEFMSPGTTFEYTLHAEWEKGRYWYVYNGSKWRKALPYIYDGSGWKKAMTYVYNGSTWQ